MSNLKCGINFLVVHAEANQMTFPEKPDAFRNLAPLEERLILPRIPFMQVRELSCGHGSHSSLSLYIYIIILATCFPSFSNISLVSSKYRAAAKTLDRLTF